MPITQSQKVSPNDLITSGSPAVVGQVLADAGSGTFGWVDNNSGAADVKITAFITDTKRRGWVDLAQTTLTVTGTQFDTVNIIDAGAGWDYYFQGQKVHITGNKSVALTGGAGNAHADGKHFVYINTNDGTLKSKTAPFSFTTEVLVAIVIWNASLPSGKRSEYSDERHTCLWDSSVHQYVHNTMSTQKISGGVVSGLVLQSQTDANKQYSVSQAVIYDEDLSHTLNAVVGGNSQYFNISRTSAGVWGWTRDNNFPYRYTTSGRMNYDDATAGGAQVDSGKYINTYILLTTIEGQGRVANISSQTQYSTLSEAVGASFSDLDLTGISLPEYVVIYKLTWSTNDSYTGTGKCQIEKIINYSSNVHDISPVGIGAPALVNPSVIGNFVSFGSTTGDQQDSGYNPVSFEYIANKGKPNGYVGLDSGSNITSGSGGFTSSTVSTAVKLGDALNTSLVTRNKTILGSVNETYEHLSYLSAGVYVTPAELTDNGNGTATISEFEALLYPNSDYTGTLEKYTIPSVTLTFTDGAEEYVAVKYNGGVPVCYKETVGSAINNSDIIPVFVIWRLGLTIHSLGFDACGVGLSNKSQSAMYHSEIYKRSTDGGLIISEIATPNPRTISATSAVVYTGAIPQTVGTFNSSTDKMTFAQHITGSWNFGQDDLVYNNSKYDNGTALVSLTAGKYGVVWFYRSIGDAKQIFYCLGNTEYDSYALASLAQPRADLPVIMRRHCLLIGRSIILANATNGVTESAFNISFTGVSPMKHNDMISIDGTGTYHISSAEATKVTNLGTISSQSSGSVAITGGSITGITDLAIADGGTGASDAGTARTNLGLGTMSVQSGSAVNITGGSISGATLTGTLTGGASLNVLKSGDTMTGKLITVTSGSPSAGFNIPAGVAPSSPVEGDIWNDSTQKSLVMREAGTNQDLVGCLFTKTNSTTVTASVTNAETSLTGTGVGTLTLPANFLTVGRNIRVRVSGIYTTSNNSATMTIRYKLGGVIIGSTAVLDPNNNLVNQQWISEAQFVAYTIGNNGTIMGQPIFKRASSASAFVEDPMPNAVPIQIDTTISNVLDFTVQYSQATVGNSITCTNMMVEIMN